MDGPTAADRPSALPSVRRVCVALLQQRQLPWERASLSHTSPPSVGRSDRSGTLGARPMHRVGPRHLSTLPPFLSRAAEERGGRADGRGRPLVRHATGNRRRRPVGPFARATGRAHARADGRTECGHTATTKEEKGKERMVVGMMAKNGWAGGTQAAAAALVLDGCCCCRLPDGRCPDIKGGLFAVLRNRSGARSDSGGRWRQNMAFALTAPPFTA